LENLDKNSGLPRPAPVNKQRSGELGPSAVNCVFKHVDAEFTPVTDDA